MSVQTVIQNRERSELHTEAHRFKMEEVCTDRVLRHTMRKLNQLSPASSCLIPANIILTKIELTIELNLRNNEFVYRCDRLTKENMVHCMFSTHFFVNFTVLMMRNSLCTDVEENFTFITSNMFANF